ncbi:DUF2087 domain-containing protein [Actinokineospora fastidiosa]|uniref:DUF2087 domain-containing protein n=1 Tax=Actinokineospora fastidiosa TaxID=1816 RepID=A0A918LG73_9PSEU|nr:DUF2087 domain-containing protein [Actinokineospora fastidiosa]GGS44387.1 hypothetical protein GCM10010171_44480 [Actinokineospora fastidiosa]
MGELSARDVVGLLAEEERLRVFAALVLGAADTGEVERVTGLSARQVGRALLKLRDGGLVSGMAVRAEVVKAAARGAAEEPESFGYADQRVEGVVRAFVRDGRLVGMPAQAAKRQVVLEHVVQAFEPGVRYGEKEVDVVLRAWCEGGGVDFVTVRRYLVDAGLLSREAGVYWRSGGYT